MNGVPAGAAEILGDPDAMIPAARLQLELLRSRSASHTFAAQIGPDGRPELIHGTDLLPGECGNPERDGDFAEAVRCFVATHDALMVGGSLAGVNLDSLQEEAVYEGPHGGDKTVTLQQYVNGVPVRPGKTKASFVYGRLVTITGAVQNPLVLGHAAPLTPAAVEDLARRLGVGATVLGSFYSVEDGTQLVEVRIQTSSSDEILELRADSGAELRRHNAWSGALPQEVSKPVQAFAYPSTPTAFAPVGSSFQQSTTMTCRDTGGASNCGVSGSGSCKYSLERFWMPLWYPQTIQDDGPTVSNTVSCGGDPFGTQTLPFLGNAFRFTSQLADMFGHWSSYFPTVESSFLVRANVKTIGDCGNGREGVYTPFDKKICLAEVPAQNLNGATNGVTMSHEYGHFVHDMYGYDGRCEVLEGWGQSFPLRMAIFKHVSTGEWPSPSANYLMSIGNYNTIATLVQHGQKLVNGEFLNESAVSGVGNADLYWPAQCGVCSGSSPYMCGSMMALTYWELAWNKCQLGFLSCAKDQDIYVGGAYGDQGWVLANSAFAYALSMATTNTSVQTFMQLVDSRYRDFRDVYGFMNAASYDRVSAVLSHHCVGWSSHCSDGSHRLPGSPLPSSGTIKATTYREAESGTKSGGAANVSSSGAAGGMLVTMPANGRVHFSINLPDSRTYRLKILASASTLTGQYSYSFNNGANFYYGGTVPVAPWTWLSSGTVTGPATIPVDIRSDGVLNWSLDVVLLEAQCNGQPCGS
ncbi:MAG: hypothetical protein IT384_20445 [Deltaproteobacteria bacterium]|nr:hypothetical protein [Deltaproteobacteria bacterium]